MEPEKVKSPRLQVDVHTGIPYLGPASVVGFSPKGHRRDAAAFLSVRPISDERAPGRIPAGN